MVFNKQKQFFILLLLLLSATTLSSTAETYALSAFMKNLHRIIKANWHPKRSNESYRIVSTFNINKDGKISDIQLITKHTDEELNQSAIKAIKISETQLASLSPIGPLAGEDTLKIEFTFDNIVKSKKEKNLEKPPLVYQGRLPLGTTDVNKIRMRPMEILKFFIFIVIVVFYLLKLLFKTFKSTKKDKKEPKHHYYDPTNVKR